MPGPKKNTWVEVDFELVLDDGRVVSGVASALVLPPEPGFETELKGLTIAARVYSGDGDEAGVALENATLTQEQMNSVESGAIEAVSDFCEE